MRINAELSTPLRCLIDLNMLAEIRFSLKLLRFRILSRPGSQARKAKGYAAVECRNVPFHFKPMQRERRGYENGAQ